MQRALGQASVAHARVGVEAAHGDPVRRAFVGKRLAPAAGARRGAAALAVADRAGAGDDVDAVGAGQRAGPAADHVVVAGVAVVAEDRRAERPAAARWRGCPRRRRAGRRTRSRCRRRRCRLRCQHLAHARGQDRRARRRGRPAGGRWCRAAPRRAGGRRHRSARSASWFRRRRRRGSNRALVMRPARTDRTPWTTRLTVPAWLGLSGDRPSAREAWKA